METQPVKIIDQEKPVPVTIAENTKLVNKADEQSLAPTTTNQEDITKQGQRAINLIWENTQSSIALLVIRVTLFMNGFIVGSLIILAAIFKVEITATIVAVIAASIGSINTVAGIVVGFYFSRTNHQKVGGVGSDKQDGR